MSGVGARIAPRQVRPYQRYAWPLDPRFAAQEDASDALIVRSTIELAHKLGLSVVASGVEDEITLAKLRELGCDSVEGFLLARPMPPEEIAAWIKESPWTKSAREKGALRRVV